MTGVALLARGLERSLLEADVFDYIEPFYNPKRRHSTLGYLIPLNLNERLD